MKNIKSVHVISAVFHVLSVIATVCLCIALVAAMSLSVFLIAEPEDTLVFSAQGNVGASINVSNIINDPFSFIKYMDDEKHLEVGDGGEISYQAKDGVLFGYTTGYKSYNQGTATFKMTSDGVFEADASSQKYVFNNRMLGFIILPTVLSLLFLLTAVFYGRRIFKELKSCVTPFTGGISKNMLKLSAVLLGYSIIPSIIGKIFLACAELPGIEKTGINLGYTHISVATIAISLVLFVIALVFSYGVSLQKQADETL